ncbi:MAG: ribonuclease [Sulfuricella sp.]|nr:ribonuclease [Sulfuricella sp.]
MINPTPAKFRAAVLALLFLLGAPNAGAMSCDSAAQALNQRLPFKIDEAELRSVLKALNASRNARLPDKFITKKDAQRQGWQPGRDLWSVPALHGKSIGGDRFGNHEGRLPAGNWREADLDYRGGHRGAKRLLFSASGMRRVTVDHYQTFVEISDCQ